jgi:hypothetical protein
MCAREHVADIHLPKRARKRGSVEAWKHMVQGSWESGVKKGRGFRHKKAYMYFGIRLESIARQESRVLVSSLDGLGAQAQTLGRRRDAGDGLQT